LPIDEKAAERVRRVLARRRTITEKKMMGALCFLTDGTMCCGITGDALMVRVGPENYDKALARPHVRPLKIGKRAANGFVLIDPPGYRTAASLLKWVEQGLAVAKVLGVRPKKRAATKRTRAVE
jgi:TfoX/Sxy family transcriptional regulator of competence genes